MKFTLMEVVKGVFSGHVYWESNGLPLVCHAESPALWPDVDHNAKALLILSTEPVPGVDGTLCIIISKQ